MSDQPNNLQHYQSLDQWQRHAVAKGYVVSALHRHGDWPLRYEARTPDGLRAGEFHKFMTPIFTRGVLALIVDDATHVPELERYQDTQFEYVNSMYPKALDLSWL